MPSIKELRQICQRSELAPSWRTQSVEGKFNRVFSIYLTWVFIHFPVSPNQITALGVLFYLGGAYLFIFNDIKLQILGLLSLFISFVLDACDGEVARYKKKEGAKNSGAGGAYVEPVSHDVMYAFFFLPIGIGAILAGGGLLPMIAAYVAAAGKLLFRLTELRLDALKKYLSMEKGDYSEFVKSDSAPATPATAVYFIYRNLFTSTSTFFILIAATAWRRLDWYLYFYAASFLLLWIYKMARQWQKIKKLS